MKLEEKKENEKYPEGSRASVKLEKREEMLQRERE